MMHRFSQYVSVNAASRPCDEDIAPPAAVAKPKTKYDHARNKRERNKSLGRCINHPLDASLPPHAKPIGTLTRCTACHEQHRGSR